MKRDINDVREIHMIPYCHTDYAWCNIRSWHICRYIRSYELMLEKMREIPEYTGTLDNVVHSIILMERYRPELIPEIAQRIREGRITIANGGASLARPTQVGEETYIRNMAASDKHFRELFGDDLDISCLFNADTSCGHPQMPQIVRKFGYDSYCFQRPETYLNKKGIPKEFTWEGVDGSKITVARGCYGGLFVSEYLEQPLTRENWNETLEGYNKNELDEHLNLLPSSVMAQFVGCDDTLPDHNIRDKRIYVDDFMRLWNESEKPRMFYSTINRLFDALKKEELPLVSGDIDPYDLSYNITKKGKNSFWFARFEGDRLMCELEATATIAASYGIPYPEEEISALWWELFECTGHAMEFILSEDIPSIREQIDHMQNGAKKLTRRLKDDIASAVCALGENSYAAINTTPYKQKKTVLFPVTDTGGIYDFTLEDAAGCAIPFSVVDYTGGDKPYEDAKYSSAVAAAAVEIEPYSVSKIYAKPTGKKRDHLTREERGFMLTAPDNERTEVTDFTLKAGDIEYKFEGSKLFEINGRGKTVRTGEVLAEFCFNETNESTTWLFDTTVKARHTFEPEHTYLITESEVYSKYKMTGKLNGHPATVILSGGVDGILHFDFEFDGYYQSGYFALEMAADANRRLTSDYPFGIRTLDFTEITPEDPMYDDWGEVTMRGQVIAKSFIGYTVGEPMAIFGVDTGIYHKYDLNNNRVCCILTAQYDIDGGVMKNEANRWERFMDRDEFGCRGKQTFHVALLPFETDSTKLARISQYERHPIEIKKGFAAKTGEMRPSAVTISGDGIVVTAVYYEGDALILRFYECRGGATAAEISACGFTRAETVDLRARVLTDIPGNGEFKLEVKPCEIVTIKLTK